MSAFNPYHVWLELSDSITAPNHFQLLGLDESEEDPKTIAAAADRAASRVRGCRPGEHASEWAALLDEIAEAKKRLRDPKQRSEYRRSLGEKPLTASRSSSAATSKSQTPVKPSRIALDPNMYPPGLAPDIAPSTSESRGSPSSEDRQSHHKQSASPVENEESIAPMDEYIPPESPHVPVVPPTDEAMQPYALPSALPMSPAGVPYLQPLDASSLADPMRPAVPPPQVNPYSQLPPGSPMAPATLDFGGAMAPLPPAGIPMAPVAMAMPAAQALPGVGSSYPMATAIPAAANPAVAPFPEPSVTFSTPSSNDRGSSLAGPIAWGLTAGFALLAIGGVYFYVNQPRGQDSNSDQVANVSDTEGESPVSPEKVPETSVEQPVPAKEPQSEITTKEMSPIKSSPVKTAETKSEVDPSPPTPAAQENKPADKPADKPPEPAKTETKPTTDSKPMPAPETSAKTDELPKLTKEDLTKLERAMTKARKAISDHEFDRAEALLSVASELPRLPEHQAMLDRLKLLSQSVRDYHKAIQESIGKLTVGSSFEVSDNTVAVVEVGPEKIIIRVNGQNRAYMIRELPFGLATALAAQSIPEDDPNTLTLKGAYVMAGSRVTPEELKKAREFLEKASGSVDTAKELLKIFDDKYELGGTSEK